MEKTNKILIFVLAVAMITGLAWAAEEDPNSNEELKVIESEQPQAKLALAESQPNQEYTDPLRYTLGPDDVIEIAVMRHPELSGTYPINLEGKIQYKFVGDIDVNGLTKKELEQKIKDIILNFVISPEVNITILEYKSKVIYVLGEVGQPGKYYMRSDSIPVREAVVVAGLPTLAAAMRRSRLVTPDKNNRTKTKTVDLYAILYGGKLKNNLEMRAGDVLYVPATIMAKVIRVINPVTSTVGLAASAPSDVSSGKSAASALAK